MADYAFVDGASPNASYLNTNVRDQGNTICTSTTRPASPVARRQITETDTGKVLQWDGAAWVVIYDPNAWTAYTPTWTGASVNPAIGNGTMTCAYQADGKTLKLRIAILMGSTTTYGTGAWSLGLPAGFTTAHNYATVLGSAYRAYHLPISWVFGGTGSSSGGMYGSSAAVSSTVPHTWATSDLLLFSGSIEVA